MPTLRNVSPLGDLEIPLIRQVVQAGAEFEVTAEQAQRLLTQSIYEPVDDQAKQIALGIAAAARPEPPAVPNLPAPDPTPQPGSAPQGPTQQQDSDEHAQDGEDQ